MAGHAATPRRSHGARSADVGRFGEIVIVRRLKLHTSVKCAISIGVDIRIIPACAGNAVGPGLVLLALTDHPRMRGERVAPVTRASIVPGSSPHARGTLRSCGDPSPSYRIIPACAGNALPHGRRKTGSPDHPRMRGERAVRRGAERARDGSSPHARGTLTPICRQCCPPRIIPACAGNASSHSANAAQRPDHPRMRGERTTPRRHQHSAPGSSPHARGTLNAFLGNDRVHRIIPACAGNALRRQSRPPLTADHPRMRGERRFRQQVGDAGIGSSPHARGTQGWKVKIDNGWRIIPACAGNAGEHGLLHGRPADHPRMRGERHVAQRAGVVEVGSSPHARGTLRWDDATGPRGRIIPACAGNAIAAAPGDVLVADHPRMRGERRDSVAD